MNPAPRLRRTFLVLSFATLGVFAALLCSLTLTMRSRLQGAARTRETTAIAAVARLEIDSVFNRMARLHAPVMTSDIFEAVLESSRLSGVLGVQLFDTAGVLRKSLPQVPSDADPVHVWWPSPLRQPASRFFSKGSLEQIYNLTPDPDAERTPLLEIIVPLTRPGSAEPLGAARYWIDGQPLADEFRRIDESLITQAGILSVAGCVLVAVLLAWSYRRLAYAHAQILGQSEDLARANEELDFAAKTGALGAISAHLIHGLKNPLAGLEGFVADVGSNSDDPAAGEARQTAIETARRVRSLVNDVVAVLKDEAAGTDDYLVPLDEMMARVTTRAEPLAQAAGVTLNVRIISPGTLKARSANLASLVLANLLGNAVDASTRHAEVSLAAGQSGEQIEFIVTDHGPGIPAAVRGSLYRPVKSSKPGGGGMGLAISHRLARHAGGELSLIRSDTAGTVFRLAVPAA